MPASTPATWNFTAPVKRFSIEGGMHYLELPNEFAEPMRATGHKRWVCTIQDALTWHCGLLPTGEGTWFVVLSKAQMEAVEAHVGDWLNVDMVPDTSKYGMPLPEDLEATATLGRSCAMASNCRAPRFSSMVRAPPGPT